MGNVRFESPMLILCPSCATSYNVEPSSLGSAGRSVRCVRCRNIWFALAPDLAQEVSIRKVAETVAAVEAEVGLPFSPPIENVPTVSEPPPDGTTAEMEPGAGPSIEDVTASLDKAAEADNGHEPAVVADAPPLVPTDLDNGVTPPSPPEDASTGIETFAARRALRTSKQKRGSRMTSLAVVIVLLIGANAALLAFRKDVVRYFPQMASLYAALGMPVNLRAVTFSDVRTTRETHDGVTVLAVEGTITSNSNRIIDIPRLRFAVRNDAGREIYSWTSLPARNVLQPGETLQFRSRLASPPAETRDVLVRFFTRRDLVRGAQ